MKYGVGSDFKTGFKGYGIGANYTLAKNIVYNVDYYDFEAKDNEAKKAHVIWNRLQFNF